MIGKILCFFGIHKKYRYKDYKNYRKYSDIKVYKCERCDKKWLLSSFADNLYLKLDKEGEELLNVTPETYRKFREKYPLPSERDKNKTIKKKSKTKIKK